MAPTNVIPFPHLVPKSLSSLELSLPHLGKLALQDFTPPSPTTTTTLRLAAEVVLALLMLGFTVVCVLVTILRIALTPVRTPKEKIRDRIINTVLATLSVSSMYLTIRLMRISVYSGSAFVIVGMALVLL